MFAVSGAARWPILGDSAQGDTYVGEVGLLRCARVGCCWFLVAGYGACSFDRRERAMSMQGTQIWVWREGSTTPIEGFDVEATDGSIGKIDEATYEIGGSYVVVDTGPWIFGKKVLLPAGVVDRIDYDNETVYIGLTKDQIKNSPEFDESTYRDDAYRTSVGDYYDQYRR